MCWRYGSRQRLSTSRRWLSRMRARCRASAIRAVVETEQRLDIVLAPGHSVGIVLQRQRRRTLAIHVKRDATVEVRAPVGCPLETVLAFVHRRRRWLNRQLERLFLSKSPHALQYRQGERHPYLGEWPMLALERGSRRLARLTRGQLRLTLPEPDDPARVKRLLEQWYRGRASEVFTTRLLHWQAHNAYRALSRPVLRLRRMRRRWGSCTSGGVITLNTRLVEYRQELIDYVIVHELCHLRVFDHSARFYALMDTVLPDWRRRRGDLESNPPC